MKVWAIAFAVDEPHMGGTSARVEIELWPSEELVQKYGEENFNRVVIYFDTKTTKFHQAMSIGGFGLKGKTYREFNSRYEAWILAVRKWSNPPQKRVKT